MWFWEEMARVDNTLYLYGAFLYFDYWELLPPSLTVIVAWDKNPELLLFVVIMEASSRILSPNVNRGLIFLGEV